jgi:hypothetical protein
MTEKALNCSGDLLTSRCCGGHDLAVSLSRDCTIILYISNTFGPHGVEHSYTLDIVLNHSPVFLGGGFRIAQTDHHKDADS